MRDTRADQAFADALRPFQRRLQVVRIMESLPAACSLGVVLAAGLVLFVRPGPLIGAAVLIGGGLIGATLATALVVSFPPSLGNTAMVIDRRYALESRAITALQFAGETDRVSQRIVSDVRARLDGLDLRRLSWSVTPRGWSTASAAAVAIVAALIMASPGPTFTHPLDGMRAVTGGSAAARTASARDLREAKGSFNSADASLGATPSTATGLPPSSGVTESGSTGPKTGDRSAAGEEGSGLPDAAAPRPSQAGSVAASTPAAGAAAEAIASVAARRGSSGPGGTAGGGATAAAPSGKAGGASDGAIVDTRTGRPAGEPITVAQYRQAVAHAEAAIAQQRVPPSLRPYVRDYFLSLREAAGR